MAVSVADSAVTFEGGRKQSILSSGSTFPGDGSDYPSIASDEFVPCMDYKMYPTEQAWTAENATDWACNEGVQNLEYNQGDDHYAEVHDVHDAIANAFVDRYEMPSTREPSPEPLWRNAYRDNNWPEEYYAEPMHMQGRHAPQKSFEEQAFMCGSMNGMNAHAQPYPMPRPMLFVVPKPVYVPNQAASLVPMTHGQILPCPTPMRTPAPRVQNALPVEPSAFPAPSASAAPAPEPKELKEPKEPKEMNEKEPRESKVQIAGASKKERKGSARNREGKGSSVLTKMSEEQKEAICKYIYDVMVEKDFTSQDGYLIVDVFTEVWKEWKDVGDTAEGSRVAQHRFADLLRSAPQYFRLFRRSIRVANQCGWFARKGEKMVRLVVKNEK